MHSGHLREWLQEHRVSGEAEAERRAELGERAIGAGEGGEKGKDRNQSKREKVVDLVQTAFRGGVLAEKATWKVVVLTPKGGGY